MSAFSDNAAQTGARQSIEPGEEVGFSRRVSRRALYKPAVLLAAAASIPATASAALAAGAGAADIEGRIRALEPELEQYVTSGMADFDVPGAAVGIVAGDRLLYFKGFGSKLKGGNKPVGSRTVFQIGSATKAIGAAVLAIAVDRGKFGWGDRVVDLDPSFGLEDAWVTREFRVFDLFAQRSGLPPYANDVLSSFGFDPDWLVHSLRFVEPATSFRSTFTYTNITHLIGGRIVAKALGAADWPALASREIVEPLGLRDTSFTAEAIEKAADHAIGHRWSPTGSVAIPFSPLFPYPFGPAGDINSSVEDCAHWVRLQLGNGSFAGQRLVSTENLAMTRTAKVSINEAVAYAMGWIVVDTPNGRVMWHNGGTYGFGAFVGFLPHQGVGAIVLTNQGNKGFPESLGLWIFDKILGNPETDHVKAALAHVKDAAAKTAAVYRKPAAPRPAPAADSLIGEYRSDMLGPATLAAGGGRLLMTLKQTGAQLALAPFDGALFTVGLVAEGQFAAIAQDQGEEPFGFAGFEADADGHLSRLRWTVDGQTFLWTMA